MSKHGLHVIYDSASQPGNHPPEIDIVAVHGLNFKNHSDHATATWTADGRLWLKDFLPDRLPKPARIMLFSYDSSPAAAGISLDEHASHLLRWLDIKRRDIPDRPIVFICHSLGGLVAKQALVEAQVNPTYNPIFAATCHMVFFATPHRGGNYANVVDVAAGLVKAVLQNTSNDLLNALKENSNAATMRFELSRHMFDKILVSSFYEDKLYGPLGRIVERKSAILGLSGSRETQLAIQADHSTICKFSASDDPCLELVMGTIVTDMGRALKLHRRAGIVNKIRTAITSRENQQAQRRFVITGMGGQGKSEVCLRVAEVLRESFWGVFWVDVTTQSTATDGYRKISKLLGPAADTIDEVQQLLSGLKYDWLLILDNADDINTDYSLYFPSGNRGAIIITSRNPECSSLNTVGSESLGILDQGECLDLFLQAAKIQRPVENEKGILQIINLLDSHTLALIQAGVYIGRKFCTIEEYPTEFKQHSKRLLSFGPTQSKPQYHNVFATFEASAQALEKSKEQVNSDALEILHVLAQFYHSDIPLQVFGDAQNYTQFVTISDEENNGIGRLSKWHVSQLPQCMQGQENACDQYRFRKAQNVLQSLSMIQHGEKLGIGTVFLHPLVHAWASKRQTKDQYDQSWISAGCVLALAYSQNTAWKLYRFFLQSHLRLLFIEGIELASKLSSTMRILQITLQCGMMMNDLRMDKEVSILLDMLFRELKFDRMEPKQDFIELYVLSSHNIRNRGNIKGSIKLLEKICDFQKTILAEDHPDLSRSQQELCMAYCGNDQIKEFLDLFKHLPQVRNPVAYCGNDQTKEFMDLFEHLLEVRNQTLGEDHIPPDQIADDNSYMSFIASKGQTEDLIQHCKRALKELEATLSQDERLLSLQCLLALSYLAKGQIKDSIQLLEHVAKIRKSSLVREHPVLLNSQYILCAAYERNGQIEDAIRLLEHVVKMRESSLVKEHPTLLESQDALAKAYGANGQFEDVILLLEPVIKIRESSLAKEDPHLLSSQHALAKAYGANGQFEDAILLLEPVIKIRESSLAKEDPHLLSSQHALAICYHATKRIEDSIRLLEHVLKIGSSTRDEIDLVKLKSQFLLAGMYCTNGQFKEAIATLEHVVRVRKSFQAKDHQDLIEVQCMLATAYHYNEQSKDSIELFEYIVKIQESTLDETDWRRLETQRLLAFSYHANGQLREAVKLMGYVIEVMESIEDKNGLPSKATSAHGYIFCQTNRFPRVPQADEEVFISKLLANVKVFELPQKTIFKRLQRKIKRYLK
ncbi:hypothetical protein FQN57_005287 [Myotisia sp. PD_48]|nr:hypothetical protein FQN57_005287 [Myotisia sp. PD_48]